MNIYAALKHAATKAQWTAEQQIDILIQYIERQQVNEAFVDYLAEESGSHTTTQTLIINEDGTATDTTTGLMWMLSLLGQSADGSGDVVGKSQQMPLDDALKGAESADFAGYHDWRVASIEELKTLVATARSIDGRWIGGPLWGRENERLWSASPHPDDTHYYALLLCVDGGYTYFGSRDSSAQVRLVRNVA